MTEKKDKRNVVCRNCAEEYRVPVGKVFNCKECGHKITADGDERTGIPEKKSGSCGQESWDKDSSQTEPGSWTEQTFKKCLEQRESELADLRKKVSALEEKNRILERRLKESPGVSEGPEDNQGVELDIHPVDSESVLNEIKRNKDREFLRALASDEKTIYLLTPTGNKVDTGGWFMNSRLWLILTDREMILAARGRNNFIRRIRFGEIIDAV